MKIAQKLQSFTWVEDEAFRDTLSFLSAHRDAVDELTLVSSSSRSYHTELDPRKVLAAVRREVPFLRRRIAALRDAGFGSVGVDVGITIGHIDECPPEEHPVLRKIVGWRGDVSAGCNCPNNEAFLRFTEEKYSLYASAGPDFLWVDDDIKLFWNGVKFGCFCEECMGKFNEKNGFSYTRETLTAAMEEPDNTQLRALWVRDVCGRITALLSRISGAVRRTDPDVRLGFMTQRQSWSTYNGMDFPAWFGALGAGKGRPGEGFYFDTVPEDVLTKTYSTAQQAFAYPETVTDVQYELENFPYDSWQKSDRISVTELALAAAEGMGGALLNNVNPQRRFEGLDRQYDLIARERPAWAAYLEAGRDWKTGGFYPAFSVRYDQLRTLEEGESFFQTLEQSPRHDVTRVYPLGKLGIPITMQPSGAWGVILTGSLSRGFTDGELTDLFRGGVLVSGDAVPDLERRGFGKYLGVCSAGHGSVGFFERFEPADPVNRGVGKVLERNVHPAFFGGEAHWFEPADPAVRVVSRMISQPEGDVGIACSLYENELGGRVCVMGYAPFLRPYDLARFRQLSEIFLWLGGDRVAARLLTPGKTALFVRQGARGIGAAVMSLSLDGQERAEVAVRGASSGSLCTPDGPLSVPCRKDGDWGVFDLGPLPPFEVRFLLTDGR